MELTAATATRHAKGAWPRFDGADMTHSADGVVTLGGESFDFSVSRYVNPRAPSGERTDYTVTLFRHGGGTRRRELTALRFEGLKAELRKAFKRQVEAMASDPTPRGVPFLLWTEEAAKALGGAAPRFSLRPNVQMSGRVDVWERGEIANGGTARGFNSEKAARAWIAEFLANEAAEVPPAAEVTAEADSPDFRTRSKARMAAAAAEVTAEAAVPVRRDNVEYHAGRDAYAAGLTLADCPHLAGGVRAARWELGWREADTRPHYVGGRSVDGAEYLTRHGFGADFSEALVMSPADAREIASREEAKAKATRSPDNGVYRIAALPWDGPRLYTLADYDRDAREAAELDAYLAAQA